MSGLILNPSSTSRQLMQDDAVITVLVSEDEKSFEVPRFVLKNASPWFRGAVDPTRFAEEKSKILILRETDPEALQEAVIWMYNGEQALGHRGRDSPGAISIKLWILVDKYFISRLQDCAMRMLYNRTLLADLSLADVRMAFNRSSQGLAIRRMLVSDSGRYLPHYNRQNDKPSRL